MPELDGMRAAAIAIVVFAHYRLIPYLPGGFGVTLFFFLSGYLITTLFYAEYRAGGAIDIARFYLRRWLRLTPSLVISVALAAIFYRATRTGVGGGPIPLKTVSAALFYYTNYYDLAWGMDPVRVVPFSICWSLAVEEHFYLAWPLILRWTLPAPRLLAIIIAALCACVLLWRTVALHYLGISIEHAEFATDCRIDSILYGALLRVLFETSYAHRIAGLLRTRPVQVLAAAALAVTFAVRDDMFRETLRYTIQGIALMPVFTSILAGNPAGLLRKVLASPPMALIGKLSYSIYLFHLLARTPAEAYFGSSYGLGPSITGLLLTAILATAMYFYVERPMAGLRHRFRAHGVRVPATSRLDAPAQQAGDPI